MGQPQTARSGRQTLIQIDIEPRHASWNYPAEHVLLGDAAGVMGQLVEAIGSRGAGKGDAARKRVAAHREKLGYFNAPEYSQAEAPIIRSGSSAS